MRQIGERPGCHHRHGDAHGGRAELVAARVVARQNFAPRQGSDQVEQTGFGHVERDAELRQALGRTIAGEEFQKVDDPVYGAWAVAHGRSHM